MVDPPICFSYFLVLASGLAGHALSSRSRVALQHGEDQKAAVGRSGDQRYQSKRSLLSGNRVITRLLPRRNPGECRATGARLLVRQESSLACCRDLPRAPLAIPVGAGLRQAECVNFMYPLTRYAVRGGGENVLLSSASLAHAPILVAGCNEVRLHRRPRLRQARRPLIRKGRRYQQSRRAPALEAWRYGDMRI